MFCFYKKYAYFHIILYIKSSRLTLSKLDGKCGAGGGTRTRTPSLVMDFESTSSTNSNTPARWGKVYNIFREISSTNYAASSSVSGGINIRFISVGSLMPGTCSVKLYCHMSTA